METNYIISFEEIELGVHDQSTEINTMTFTATQEQEDKGFALFPERSTLQKQVMHYSISCL